MSPGLVVLCPKLKLSPVSIGVGIWECGTFGNSMSKHFRIVGVLTTLVVKGINAQGVGSLTSYQKGKYKRSVTT